MSPFVHGRIYPETESSELLGYTLRVLVDPRTAEEHARAMLDIDTLRVYLRTVDSPCRIVLLLPARGSEPELDTTYEFMRRLDVEELPSSMVVAPEAAAAFPGAPGDSAVLALASTAWFADADVVVSEALASQAENVSGFQKLHIELVDVRKAKQTCEVFVRGHEVPWSFRLPAWLMPWTPFYSMVDADIQAMEELRSLAAKKGTSPDVQERIRSLGLNRWSAIAYTGDKLLFFMISGEAPQAREAGVHVRAELPPHRVLPAVLGCAGSAQLDRQ
jgi:hypothetical protein